MSGAERRAVFSINGIEIARDEFEKRVGSENFFVMLEDAFDSYNDVGGQSVYTVGNSPDRFIIDFEEDAQ